MDMQLKQIDLEKEHFAQAQKEQDLALGVKMLETYQNLRKKGVTKAMIVATFPHMKSIADADVSDDN